MDFGEKIKQMRTLLNLTQEELANRCELTKSYISQLENNKTSPSLATLEVILEVLGTNFSDFFSEEKEPQIVFTKEEQFIKSFDGYDITWLVPASQRLMMEPILMEISPYSHSIDTKFGTLNHLFFCHRRKHFQREHHIFKNRKRVEKRSVCFSRARLFSTRLRFLKM